MYPPANPRARRRAARSLDQRVRRRSEGRQMSDAELYGTRGIEAVLAAARSAVHQVRRYALARVAPAAEADHLVREPIQPVRAEHNGERGIRPRTILAVNVPRNSVRAQVDSERAVEQPRGSVAPARAGNESVGGIRSLLGVKS